jgi:DedD protein
MDAALKQRLIGATVLVALAVIFLPMLIDGPEAEREAESEQLSLDLPTRPDRPMETREIALQPAPLPTPVVPAAGSDVLPVVDTGAEQRVDALSGEPAGAGSDPVAATSSSASAASAPATARTDATPPAATASTSSAPSATPRPAATAPVSPRPAAATSAAPAPAPALPTATAGGRYAVNVGSYANVANAENLLTRLKNAGISAYSESVNLEGRPVRRVRLGPFAQRSEAERARQAALAVQRDLPTSVISLDAGAAPAPARAPATEGFAVQLGALRSETDANALRDRARAAGFVAFVERVNAEAGVLWRVRVGPELDRASAERRRGELKSKLNIDGLVVSHP